MSSVTNAVSLDPSGSHPGVGALLRSWRDRRRLSQLELATAADVSTRHLSYVETGRSTPSRELLLHLARHLDVPHREQNDLLLAAGYAPAFVQLDLEDPAMAPVVTALRAMLAGNEPNPTLVMDRYWNVVLANESALGLVAGVPESLLGPPLNIMLVTLHPDGLAPAIVNFDEVATHLLDRTRRQLAVTGDPAVADVLDRARALVPELAEVHPITTDPALPVRIVVDGVERTYLSVVSTFGTALDVTTSELVVETFYEI